MLRLATAADLDPLIAIASRHDIAKTLATDVVADLSGALEHEAGELFVIEDGGELVGGLRWVLVNRRSRIASIHSLMIHPAVRGRGLATTAVRELAERLFTVHWLHRVEAEVYGFNHAAQRVFERAGSSTKASAAAPTTARTAGRTASATASWPTSDEFPRPVTSLRR
jgi:RimJ/RimL family protein N-acetyltransferase